MLNKVVSPSSTDAGRRQRTRNYRAFGGKSIMSEKELTAYFTARDTLRRIQQSFAYLGGWNGHARG